MENATKALIMAGGILIALMILGALMLMFNNLSSYQKQNETTAEQVQIAEFNNQYMPYEKENLTIMELKSVYHKIKSNNEKYPEYKINHNIENVVKTKPWKTYFLEEQNNKFIDRPDQVVMDSVFKCKNIGYSKEGRINKMLFEQIN